VCYSEKVGLLLEPPRTAIADLKRMERVLKDVVAQCGDRTLPEFR